MRVRTIVKLGASLVVALAAVALMAPPASAASYFRITQFRSGGEIFSQTYFDGNGSLGRPCPNEVLEVQDWNTPEYGTEARVWGRKPGSTGPWTHIKTMRVFNKTVFACINIIDGFEVKLATWKYNAAGPDRWNEKVAYGWA